MVDRSMVVGHILTDHTYSLMGINHRDMTAHTPDFYVGYTPEKMKGEYLDMYEGIKSEIL